MNFYFALDQIHIKIACFLGISYIRSILYTKCSTLFFKAYSAANFLSLPQKVGLYDHQNLERLFPSHQQGTDLNNRRQIQ